MKASQYITIDSKDRNQSVVQPWNHFTLQKPQSILDAFAKKVVVSEIRFPWFIPNISSLNNVFAITAETASTAQPMLITVPPGFYSPAQLVSKINNLIATGSPTFINPPILSYNSLTLQYTWTAGVGPFNSFVLYWFNYLVYANAPSEIQYLSQASLMRTMGFDFSQVSGSPSTTAIVGVSTQTLYTSYVDITSTRLTRLQNVRDGDSATNSSSGIICRIYLADEASIPLMGYLNASGGTAGTYNYGSFPLLIHRQFKNPKVINWNPDVFVDYMDITVLDEFNNIVPLLYQPTGVSGGGTFPAQYPDFQITFLASE